MKIEHDLKALLSFDLPNVLTKNFFTKLYDESIKVSQYVQKLTFVMNDQGIEAFAASGMGRPDRGCRHPSGPEIIIDGPFSFALVKKLEDQNLLLLSGQVVDHSVLKIIQR